LGAGGGKYETSEKKHQNTRGDESRGQGICGLESWRKKPREGEILGV